MSRKHSYDYVKKEFEKYGYTLLSADYVGNKQKLEYLCPKGHKHSMNYSNWKEGKRCAFCSGNVKHNIGFVKDAFERVGYTLLTTEYVNEYQKLTYICSNGHTHSVSWHNWQRGRRCPYCSRKIKPTIDYVKESFETAGYILLTDKYTNCDTYLYYICPVGHHSKIVWTSWQQGNRCSKCAHIKISGPGHPAWCGGISFEPYCVVWKDQEYKNDIKQRDGYRCLNPHCSKADQVLSIHHIDYNKKNCRPGNLITLCRSCNSKANVDREWHTTFYNALLRKRLGGKL